VNRPSRTYDSPTVRLLLFFDPGLLRFSELFDCDTAMFVCRWYLAALKKFTMNVSLSYRHVTN